MARQRAERFALIVAGSSWNEAVLRGNGVVAATTVLQGVDTSTFHPAPRQRHPEALLLTAWHTPWEWHDTAFAPATQTVPAPRAEDGSVDTAARALANGVPSEALIALGQVPNIAMPHIIREADVALFPNRCEGGTNLAAMEWMACGIPTILSSNTGHLDLLTRDAAAIPLDRQRPVSAVGYETTDWGESDVEEIVEALETVWSARDAAAEIGRRGAPFMAEMTWTRQTERLLRAIDPFLP